LLIDKQGILSSSFNLITALLFVCMLVRCVWHVCECVCGAGVHNVIKTLNIEL